MPEQIFQKRGIAYKLRVSDILNGSFAKDNSSAVYLKLGNINVSRVNIIANLIYKSDHGNSSSFIIDDGTGKISLKLFENSGIFSKADVGDFVMVIGKVREFNTERYIVPEIVNKIEELEWLNVRKLELQKANFDEIVEGNKSENAEVSAGSNEDVYLLIKNLDKGEGVDFDEVVRSSGNSNAEGIITKLLENGDVFEIKPGRLKVLE